MLLDKKNEKMSPKEAAQTAVAEILNKSALSWKEVLIERGFPIKPTDREIEKTEEQMEKILVRIFKSLKKDMNLDGNDSENSESSEKSDEEDSVTNEDLEEVLEDEDEKPVKKIEVSKKKTAEVKKKGKK